MIKINKVEMVQKLTHSTKFDTLTFSKNGLLLKYRNEQEVEIPFTNLEKIYFKKHKLHPIVELIVISLPFIIVFKAVQYLPFLMTIVSLVSVLPVFLFFINYKLELNICVILLYKFTLCC